MTTLSITSKIQKVTLRTSIEKKEIITKFGARQGPSGPPGKSAYELAVEAGFIGTEEQWVASLGLEGMFDNYPDDLLAGYQIAKL